MKLRYLQSNKQNREVLIDAVMSVIKELDLVKKLNQDNSLVDFSEYLFVFPTKEASRLFRERLAEYFMEYGGVLSLNAVQAEYFLYDLNDKTLMNKGEILEIWSNTLKTFDESLALNIIKNNCLSKNKDNYSWLLNFSSTLHDLRKEIALEKGCTIEEFYQQLLPKVDSNFLINTLVEKLAEYRIIEEEFIKAKGDQLVDEADLILKNIKETTLQDKNIKKVIFFDCCELKSSMIKAFENLEDIEFTLYLNAHESEAKLFDNYGRVSIHEARNLKLPIDIKEQVRMYSSPTAMAKKISSLVTKEKSPSVIGVLDNEIANSLNYLLKEKDINFFAPDSPALSSLNWTKLFILILNLAKRNITFDEFATLVRNGLFSTYLRVAEAISNYKMFLISLDKLQNDHLIDTLVNLKSFAEKSLNDDKNRESYQDILNVIDEVASFQRILRDSDNILVDSWKILSTIGEFITPQDQEDFYLANLEIENLKKIINQVKNYEDKEFKLELFKYLLKECRIEIKGDENSHMDLAGFLEILWRKDKKLLLAGFNESSFDCSESQDIFLPEQVRELLNFTTQKQRHATDIYHFYAMNLAHEVGILVGKKITKVTFCIHQDCFFILKMTNLWRVAT